MTASFLLIMGAYAATFVLLMAVVIGCFWDGWRG